MIKLSVTERQVAADDFETTIVEENENGTIIRTIATVHIPEYAEKFAAAPELLEALQQALLNEGRDGCTKSVIGWCLCWRCKARAAIAKAKGES